jgi:hypothetical protein
MGNRKQKNVGKEDENEDERDNSMRLNRSMKCNVPNLIHHLPETAFGRLA